MRYVQIDVHDGGDFVDSSHRSLNDFVCGGDVVLNVRANARKGGRDEIRDLGAMQSQQNPQKLQKFGVLTVCTAPMRIPRLPRTMSSMKQRKVLL